MGHSNLKHCQIGRHLSWMQRNNVIGNKIVFFPYCGLVYGMIMAFMNGNLVNNHKNTLFIYYKKKILT